MSKCAFIAGHFDGHAEALKQESTWHCMMQNFQGYIGCPWMLPSGDYSLRIAQAAAMAMINKATMQNVLYLLAISMAIATRRYSTARIV